MFTISKYIRKGLQTFVLRNQKRTYFDFIELQTHANLISRVLKFVSRPVRKENVMPEWHSISTFLLLLLNKSSLCWCLTNRCFIADLTRLSPRCEISSMPRQRWDRSLNNIFQTCLETIALWRGPKRAEWEIFIAYECNKKCNYE